MPPHEHVYGQIQSGRIGEVSSEALKAKYPLGAIVYRKSCSVCHEEKEWTDDAA